MNKRRVLVLVEAEMRKRARQTLERDCPDGGYDYKDLAEAENDAIGEILDEYPRLGVFFQDMPDGFQCPRSFGEWWGRNLAIPETA